jgi:hypothetical protein
MPQPFRSLRLARSSSNAPLLLAEPALDSERKAIAGLYGLARTPPGAHHEWQQAGNWQSCAAVRLSAAEAPHENGQGSHPLRGIKAKRRSNSRSHRRYVRCFCGHDRPVTFCFLGPNNLAVVLVKKMRAGMAQFCRNTGGIMSCSQPVAGE